MKPFAERLTEADLPAVAELESLCFPAPWSENALKMLLGQEGSGIVCRENGRVVAYGGVFWGCDEGQITNVAVRPEFRRRGYGEAILSGLLSLAKERGCAEVSLEVRVSNEGAIALYRKAGFETVGIRKHFYTRPNEDAMVMVLRLDPEERGKR